MRQILTAVLAMVMVSLLVTAAFAQETSTEFYLARITGMRLISTAGPTILHVDIQTWLDDARYKINYDIFNMDGVEKRSGTSGWFVWNTGNKIGLDIPIDPQLKGDGYYVKAVLVTAPLIENEK